MSTNYHSTAFGPTVRRRYESLVARNANPTLAAIQHELSMLDGVRLTEEEISEHLGGLDAGRRGTTGQTSEVNAASLRAAAASHHAEKEKTLDAHFAAQMAHSAAACVARSLSEYHDEQTKYHGAKASAKPGTETPPVESSRASHPLMCARSLVSLVDAAPLPDAILYMPAGIHQITPSQGGKPVAVVVQINKLSAARMEQQRQAMTASGGKPFFSVQHNTQIAAFWPTKFSWDCRRAPDGKMVQGVWADGDWSQAGKEAVEGKNFRSFSPTFFVDKNSTDADDPAQVICVPDAAKNMGALENDPAFEKISPLWHDGPRA